jgi:hypothetical protein
MKFKKHQCIEVHHQYGVKHYECESFVDAAMSGDYDTWDYETFTDMDAAAEVFGGAEYIPAELADLLKSGPAVGISEPGLEERFIPAADFDAEAEAKAWLAHDLSQLIVIDSTEDAKYEAANYRGHEKIKVRIMAEKILEMAKDGYIEEAEQ